MDFTKIEEFIQIAHAGQKRKGGDEYYHHPIKVRDILVSYGITNTDVLAAALLHDVLEDTPHTVTEIIAVSNPYVGYIVQEVTRIHPENASWEEKAKILESKARSFTRAATLVKMADRLHNLRTAKFDFTPDRCKRYAVATLSLLEAMPKAEEVCPPLYKDLKYMADSFSKE